MNEELTDIERQALEILRALPTDFERTRVVFEMLKAAIRFKARSRQTDMHAELIRHTTAEN